MDCSTLGFPVHHQLPELTQTHVRWVGDAIQPSHPLSSPFPSAFSLWTKLVEVIEFQLSYSKSWKMILWKCCTQYASKFGNAAVATGLEKVSFHSNPKNSNAKECSNYCTIALISHASKVMLKILQARLQQYMNRELPYVQAGFRKGRGCRDEIDNIHCIIRKARKFQKNIYFCFIDYTKVLTMLITTNSGKFFKRWEYQTPYLPPEKWVCRSKATVWIVHGTAD